MHNYCSPFEGDAKVVVSPPQSHHNGGVMLLSLQKQHRIGCDVKLTPMDVSKKQRRTETVRGNLFTVHMQNNNCSVVFIQSVSHIIATVILTCKFSITAVFCNVKVSPQNM